MTDPISLVPGKPTLHRRSLITNIALAIGATVLPLDALASNAQDAAIARFLSPPQYAVLEALADTLIPRSDSVGAFDANVPMRLDSLLRNWAAPAKRSLAAAALDRLEAASRAQTGKGFAALSARRREALLRAHDKAALQSAPPPPDAQRTATLLPTTSVADPGYLTIKELVLDLYYYSPEATAAELVYEHVPGSYEPSIKLTRKSRPQLGAGPF